MRWTSLNELKEHLNLQVNSTEPDEIKSEIRKQLALIHPDKNNGEFSSSESKQRFNLLTEALDYLDEYNRGSQALIPVNQITELVKAVNTALSPARDERALNAKNEIRSNYKDEISSSYSFPRISSGALVAICGVLLAFQENFKGNRIIGEWVSKYNSQLFILMLFIMFGMFFILTWVFERRDEVRDEWLLSEVGRKFLFEKLLEAKLHDKKEGGPIFFTLYDLTDEIKRLARYRTKVPLYFRRISESLAEKIAKLHIEELEHCKVIKKVEVPRLDPMYEINDAVLENFRALESI